MTFHFGFSDISQALRLDSL